VTLKRTVLEVFRIFSVFISLWVKEAKEMSKSDRMVVGLFSTINETKCSMDVSRVSTTL
jgi:hypothetical protein